MSGNQDEPADADGGREPDSGADDDEDPAPDEEPKVGVLVREFLYLLGSDEFGPRFDTLVGKWAERETNRLGLAKTSHWLRFALSVAALAGLCGLALLDKISGEATVGLLGSFVGYLWGGRRSGG